MSKFQTVLKILPYCMAPIGILMLCWDLYNWPGIDIEFTVKQVSQLAGATVTQISMQHNLASVLWWIVQLIFDCWVVSLFADVWEPVVNKVQKKS